jgi:hypothetical protein
MAMKQKQKDKLLEIIVDLANDMTNTGSEKERMELLKDFNRLVHVLQPIAGNLVMEEREEVREQLLENFKKNLDKIKVNL